MNNTTTPQNPVVWTTEQMMIIIQKAEELSPILGIPVSSIVKSLLDIHTPTEVKVMIDEVPVTPQETPILADEVTEENYCDGECYYCPHHDCEDEYGVGLDIPTELKESPKYTVQHTPVTLEEHIAYERLEFEESRPHDDIAFYADRLKLKLIDENDHQLAGRIWYREQEYEQRVTGLKTYIWIVRIGNYTLPDALIFKAIHNYGNFIY